ncbi:uncharacterized protein LOC144099989 [Amblyomma americanum]
MCHPNSYSEDDCRAGASQTCRRKASTNPHATSSLSDRALVAHPVPEVERILVQLLRRGSQRSAQAANGDRQPQVLLRGPPMTRQAVYPSTQQSATVNHPPREHHAKMLFEDSKPGTQQAKVAAVERKKDVTPDPGYEAAGTKLGAAKPAAKKCSVQQPGAKVEGDCGGP